MSDDRTFREVSNAFGLPTSGSSEYDWQLVRALAVVAAVRDPELRLVFSGGSALRQAHQIVPRMSMDADLRVISDAHIRRPQLRALRRRVGEALRDAGFAFDPDNPVQCWSRNVSRYAAFRIPFTPVTPDPLRSQVQIELAEFPLRTRPVERSVASLVARAMRAPPEIPSMLCVSLEETMADKVVGFTRRVSNVVNADREPRSALMRHLYDVHMLAPHVDGAVVAELAAAIAEQERREYRGKSPGFAADPGAEAAAAVTALMADPRWRAVFDEFQDASVYGERADFAAAVASVGNLVSAWRDRLA